MLSHEHVLLCRDPQWSLVDTETKKQMEWRQHGDGEFWMKYEDFCREFEGGFHLHSGARFRRRWHTRETRRGNAAAADDTTASVVVALMQVHPPHNAFITRNRLRMHQIGFVIYQALDQFRRLSLDHFARTPDVANSGAYINYREVFGRFELRPGHYVIIPATFDPHCPGAFMIRVYASSPFQLRTPVRGVRGKPTTPLAIAYVGSAVTYACEGGQGFD
ncbi:hypothetical protein MTO96_016378 [Rhipicephalus appendiculatus]